MDFFSRDAGTARRNALAESLDGLAYFVPPELRPWLGIANELNPVVSMERAGTNALAVADPSRSGWERVQALGDMTGNMAGAVAPMVAASRGAVPAVQAAEDALMGWSTAAGVPEFMADEFGGVGFRAYHGSPHDFDRFSLDKIGTGEGAQAYGHGLYFADSEDVARSYRDKLAPMNTNVKSALRDAGGDFDAAIAEAQRRIALYEKMEPSRTVSGLLAINRTKLEELLSQKAGNAPNPGRMYEVQINANPEDFLDWDKPLSEQPAAMRAVDALTQSPDTMTRLTAKTWRDYPPDSGERFIRALSGIADGGGSRFDSATNAAASEMLREAGIPGIRYLDAGSRGAGDGSRNYVVFDDKLIEIIRKYGWAAAAPIFAASGLTVEEAQAQYEGQM